MQQLATLYQARGIIVSAMAGGAMATCSSLDKRLEDYILGVPKAELHVHIEGTLEPELVYEIAARNGICLEGSAEELKIRRENFKVSE